MSRTVLLGVTGSIAAYKAVELVRLLVKNGDDVHVIMTSAACEFVRPLTFQTLSRNPVEIDQFAAPAHWKPEHISLAECADLVIVAPATANTLAKMRYGLADNLLTATLLATRAPIVVAPAMNTGMWENAATRQNVETLRARGARLIGPEGGFLACGDQGAGRMSEPETIFDAIAETLARTEDMRGLRVLVTAGPTQEKIDPVRYLTNRSSGKMGYAVAQAAAERGARVTLVSGPVRLAAPAGVEMVPVVSTQDLYNEMTRRCGEADVIVQAAAPADFTPVSAAEHKLKKQGGDMTLALRETPDVAAAVGRLKREGQTLVGFAAETDNVLENAGGKLLKKRLDMIVANDVTAPGAGFDVDTNVVTFITKDARETLPLMSKREVAQRLLSRVLALRGAR